MYFYVLPFWCDHSVPNSLCSLVRVYCNEEEKVALCLLLPSSDKIQLFVFTRLCSDLQRWKCNWVTRWPYLIFYSPIQNHLFYLVTLFAFLSCWLLSNICLSKHCWNCSFIYFLFWKTALKNFFPMNFHVFPEDIDIFFKEYLSCGYYFHWKKQPLYVK